MNISNKLLLVILTGIAFGSSIVFARFALKEFGPFPVTVLRFGIASAAFSITLLFQNKQLPTDIKKLRDIIIVGIFTTGLPILLYYLALTHISSGIFTIFLSSLPLVTALLAYRFLKNEKLSANLVTGLILAFGGVVLLIATKSSGLAGGVYDIKGPLFTFAGVFSAAFGSIYAKSRLDKDDVLVISAGQTLAAFIFIIVFVFTLGKLRIPPVSLLGWFSVIYNGIVGSYIAFWLVFTLIKKYGATASSLPNYVIPVVLTLMGSVLLGELITVPLKVSAVVILTGVFFSGKQTKNEIHKPL